MIGFERRQIIADMIDTLRAMDDGSRTTVAEVLEASEYDADDFQTADLMELMDLLFQEAKAVGMDLDMSEHEGALEGLPCRLDFVVHNRDAQIRCPRCGSSDIARILYGMPAFSEELEQQMREGKIVLGGCCIMGNDPTRHCNGCGFEFGAPQQPEQMTTEG